MAATALELCNDALSEIGAANITSLTANATKEDRVCNQFYAKLRDELLKQFSWNFAKKATPLNRIDLFDTSDDYGDYATISGITLANPVVIAATRDAIISLLSTKTSDQILTVEGKDKLRREVRERVNAFFAGSKAKVQDVYIVEFVVQL